MACSAVPGQSWAPVVVILSQSDAGPLQPSQTTSLAAAGEKGSHRMCGIAGVVGRGECVPPQDLLERLGQCMLHRGPDGAGYHRGPGVDLVSRRLRIIDLETGDQPLRNEDDSVTV